MNIYCVFTGRYHTNGYLTAVYHKKKDAVSDIRDSGEYKYNRKQKLYLNEKRQTWYRVNKVVADCLFGWIG